MKTNFLKSIFFVATIAALFTSCVADDDYSTPSLECVDSNLTANKKVADVLAQATATATLYTNAQDHFIEARIVSSDKGGNFYKVIYLNSLPEEGSTETLAFSLAVNDVDLFTKYDVGRKVYIKLNGLYTQIRNNTLQIGALYNGNVGQIAALDYEKHIFRSCQIVEEVELLNDTLKLAEINDSYIGKLIEFNNVQFADTALGQNYYNPSNVLGGETNHLITDATGATLIFRTGSFAEYAGTPVSSKSGKIRGILTKFGTTYQFVARYAKDINLTEARIGGEPGEPEPEPEPTGDLLFAGSDFENWTEFTGGLTTHGLKPYAVQGMGTGMNGSNSLHLLGTTEANDYVFTALAQAGVPANATKISFFVKGTSTPKSLSVNVYRSIGGYDVFNVGDLSSAAVTLNKAALQPTGTPPNGTNSYTGSINTADQWVKVTLNIADVQLSTTVGQSLFAIKTGSGSVYDLHIDNITIE